MSGSVTVTLRKPIAHGSESVSELVFQPMKAKHLKRLESSPEQPIKMALELAQLLTGQPVQVIDELEGADLREVLQVASGFFAAGQPTGGES